MSPRSPLRTIGTPLLFAVLPAVVLIGMFVVAFRSQSLAVDFQNEIYVQAKAIVAGDNPYPRPDEAIRGSNHLWPALVAFLAAPLTLVPVGTANVIVTLLGLACWVGALRLVGVSDWRVYGALALWAPVATEMRTAHLTPVLALLVALAWRTRERTWKPGMTVGVAIALKFFLWPLTLWLLAVRRRREAAVAAATALVSLLLLLPYIGPVDYVRFLSRVGRTFDQDSYTPYGLLVQAGTPEVAARIVGLSVGLAVLGLAWHRRSLTLFVAVALLLSPVVWFDYFALLAVPLAVSRPVLGPIWLLPVLTWGVSGAGAGIGNAWATTRVLVVFAIVVWVSERAERPPLRTPAVAANEPSAPGLG